MHKIRARVMGLAPLRTPVWVGGEEGTGRSLVVRILHEFGATAEGDLVTIDCANWESARGMPRAGAIHLKGVEQLSPSAQAFWSDRARELESHGFSEGPRLFASGLVLLPPSDSRAYDGPLCAVLKRFPIELPPLRERAGDVPAIANSLVRKISAEMGRETRLTGPARVFLRERSWPENVAQLEELLERAVAFTRDRLIRRDQLLEITADLDCNLRTIRRLQGAKEYEDLLAALRESGGNISRTALRMEKSRGAVYRLLDKYGMGIPRSR
jgi:DNA-binding NtrC family response regulator